MKVTRLLCHRNPERTFKIGSTYFPVCSRCTGVYLGAFSYFALAYMVHIKYSVVVLLVAGLLVIPTFWDGFTQLFFSRESNNYLRFFTGILAGWGMGILVKALKFALFTP